MVINMKITVLAGGTSTERDVSLVTGSMIYKSLVKSGHQVVLVDLYLGYDGADYTDVFAIKKDWSESIQAISSQNPDIRQVRAMRKDDPYNEVGPHVIDICKQSDIVFLALHGQNGEDGKVQAMFDLLHIKYTGTDYFSSALAMDKVISKELFIKYDIPTPKGITLTVGQEAQWDTYPCIVKVNRGGSSVGVYKAENAQELQDALKQAFSQDGVPHQIIRNIIPHITDTTNNILGQMTGGTMGVEFVMERTVKGKDGDKATLDVLINEYGKTTLPYASKSGGEKVKASLAVILALSEIKATAAGIQLGMLFIDEPPFLDDEGAQAYVDALETIRDRYSDVKIMAITHDDAMKARFGQAVTVIKTDDGSKVIY